MTRELFIYVWYAHFPRTKEKNQYTTTTKHVYLFRFKIGSRTKKIIDAASILIR